MLTRASRSRRIRAKRWWKSTRPKGAVPHHLPGTNHVPERVRRSAISVPEQAARGGAETMYPEYRLKLKTR